MGMGLTVWKMSNKSNAIKPFKILFFTVRKNYSIKLQKIPVEFRKFMGQSTSTDAESSRITAKVGTYKTTEQNNHYLIKFLELFFPLN